MKWVILDKNLAQAHSFVCTTIVFTFVEMSRLYVFPCYRPIIGMLINWGPKIGSILIQIPII